LTEKLGKITAEESYTYKKEGYIIKNKTHNFRTGKNIVNEYRYEYENYE
jgi:hypothetical protein